MGKNAKTRLKKNGSPAWERDPVETVMEISSIRTAVLDSCTLILLEKAGILDRCARAIAFVSVDAVQRETGYSGTSVSFQGNPVPEVPATADESVMAFAKARNLPLASDDGKLLSKASRKTDTIDSLDILLAAYLKGSLDETEYDKALAALSLLRPYPARRLALAAELFEAAQKIR